MHIFNLFSTSCLPPQSTLNLTNPNFFSVLVQSVSCQVLYMKTVIGTRLVDTPTTIQPLSHRQVKLQRVCFRRAATHKCSVHTPCACLPMSSSRMWSDTIIGALRVCSPERHQMHVRYRGYHGGVSFSSSLCVCVLTPAV